MSDLSTRQKTFKDETGHTFGSWTVLEYAGHVQKGMWRCRCQCGNEGLVPGFKLRGGRSSKCARCQRRDVGRASLVKGSLNKAMAAASESGATSDNLKRGRKPKHGHSLRNGRKTATYQSWEAMNDRCYRKGNKHYDDYGGRGITVCERWRYRTPHAFENFLADMGERPDGMTIDRFPDNDGNYEPGNCRWATRSEQAKNQRKRKPK